MIKWSDVYESILHIVKELSIIFALLEFKVQCELYIYIRITRFKKVWLSWYFLLLYIFPDTQYNYYLLFHLDCILWNFWVFELLPSSQTFHGIVVFSSHSHQQNFVILMPAVEKLQHQYCFNYLQVLRQDCRTKAFPDFLG